jgi:hypothetical protein
VNSLWAAISGPLSQVRVAIMVLGRCLICSPRAQTTLSVSLPPTRTNITNRELRSTRVATWVLREPSEQIPFPVSGHRPILCLRRALADGDGLLDLPARLSPRRGVAALAHHPPASKVREQLPFESASGLHEQGAVDGLV